MARPGRPERNRTARSFRQLRRFHHVITSDRVFGTHKGAPAVVVALRPALLNSVDKVLILRAGRAEAFASPSDVLHRLVRSPVGAGADKPEEARRIESSGP